MIEVAGAYNNAKVMIPLGYDIEEYAITQIRTICDSEGVGKDIVIMPDVHPGKVGPIGLTMNIAYTKYIMPSLLGPDIGCGIIIAKLNNRVKKEYERIDTVIRENVPAGNNRFKAYEKRNDKMCLHTGRSTDEFSEFIGTLGAGNHFIEIDVDEYGNYYLVVHSGSRGLGHYVYDYYMKEGQKVHKEREEDVPYELTKLCGCLAADYVDDVKYCQEFAYYNRKAIITNICKKMKWEYESVVDVPHNFISFSSGKTLLRKGACSARSGETVIIPVNSRDGIIIGVGKGNTNWNSSAPHGSGRLIKRSEVANLHTVSEYKKIMKESKVYSPNISAETLSEAPFAYRDLNYIKEAIKDTVDITRVLKPIYNFKAGDNQ